MNALIIEDEKEMASVLRSWLEQMGFSVTVTDSMALAAEIIASTPELEVITLDLNLKDSMRPSTIPRIREIRATHPNALLVIVSGVLTTGDEKLVAEYGGDAAIEKHDVATEKTFGQKLWDVVSSLVKNPQAYASRIPILEAISKRVSKRCNELGCTIAMGEQPPKLPTSSPPPPPPVNPG